MDRDYHSPVEYWSWASIAGPADAHRVSALIGELCPIHRTVSEQGRPAITAATYTERSRAVKSSILRVWKSSYSPDGFARKSRQPRGGLLVRFLRIPHGQIGAYRTPKGQIVPVPDEFLHSGLSATNEPTADAEILCAIACLTLVPQGEHGHLVVLVPAQSNMSAVAKFDQQLPTLGHFLDSPAKPRGATGVPSTRR